MLCGKFIIHTQIQKVTASCDSIALGQNLNHSSERATRAAWSLIDTHTFMHTHTLMHPPHPPTHSVVVSTMCPHWRRAVALWCGHHLQLQPGFIHILDWGFCLLQGVSIDTHGRDTYTNHFLATLCCGYRVNHLRDACADKHTARHGLTEFKHFRRA